jgi:hypothetical protein
VSAITNAQSQAMTQRALNNVGDQLSAWPGREFSMDTPEGKAILGTQVGFPLGYLLIEHKVELGNLRVSKVRVFHNETPSQQLCFVFSVQQPTQQSAAGDTLYSMGGVGGSEGTGLHDKTGDMPKSKL